MPKTAKKGFTYFRFETDHFYDPKVKRLKNKFGMEGWGVYHFIINEIFRVEGCYMLMDADGLFDISDYSRMDEHEISSIIDYCADLGLFNKALWRERQILTSEDIQELYVGICKAIHRKPSIPGDIFLLSAEESPASVPAPLEAVSASCHPGRAEIPVSGRDTPSPPENVPAPEQAVSGPHTLPASDTVNRDVRENTEIPRENKPHKIKEKQISSPTPPAQPAGNPAGEEDGISLSGKLKYLGVSDHYIGWVHVLKRYYPDFPIERGIRELEQSNFQLTNLNFLYPLIENYIAKYNAEYGQADRQRRQEETMRNRRKTLDLLGIAARDQQEILQLASVAPVVLDTALKETWGNKKIKSPTRFLLSRMRQAVPA